MGPPPRADELVAGRDDERRGRWLRRIWPALPVGVLLGLLVSSGTGLSLHGQRDGPEPDVPTPLSTPALPGVTWNTRGDLAGDDAFLAAAVDRIREERPDVARIYFAGHLPDGSRLVLAGSDVARGMVATAVHALLIQPSVPVDESPVTEVTALTYNQDVLGWAGRGSTGSVSVVVLARPGPARFELSPRVLVGRDGALHREWTSVVANNGAAVLDVGSDTDPVVAVRAEGAGVFRIAQVVRVRDPADGAPVALSIEGVDAPGYHGPDPELLAQPLRETAGSLADLAHSRLRILWSGAPWKGRRLALVLVTRPDGVRLQALIGQQDQAPFPAGVRALPTEDPDNVPWLLEPFSPQDPTFLLCPTGAGTLLYSRPGRAVHRLRVPSSGAVVVVEPGPSPPSARGADVTLLGPAGRTVLRTTLPSTGTDDTLALSSGFPTEAAR